MKRKRIKSEKEVEDKISQVLDSHGINFKREVVVGGVRSDFFMIKPTGGTAIFEVKQWEPTQENINRARTISNYMTSGSGVDNTYIIMPSLPENYNDPYIITPTRVIDVLNTPLETSAKKKPPVVLDKPLRKVFVAMPFAKEYDDTFFVGIQPIVTRLKFDCIRIDQEPIPGDTTKNIKQMIEDSAFIIADVSESKPNVLFEMGYAEGNKLKVFQICSTGLDNLPFDIRNNKTIYYSKGQTKELSKVLNKTLRQFVKLNDLANI
jgi:hypothetical protein